MFRHTTIVRTDSFKTFSTALLHKLKACRTAVELQAAVRDVIERESVVLPQHRSGVRDWTPRAESRHIANRRGSTVHTLLVQCQTHRMWRQAYVVLSTAVGEFGVAMKPTWPKMVVSAAPDSAAREEVKRMLKSSGLLTSEFSSSSNDSAGFMMMRDDNDTNDDVATEEQKSNPRRQGQENNNNNNGGSGGDQNKLMLATKTPASSFAVAPEQDQRHINKLAAQQHLSTNPLFDQFYLRQRVAKNEMEMALLTDALKKRPTLCFRVNKATNENVWPAVVAAAQSLPFVKPLPWVDGAFELVAPSSSHRHDDNNKNITDDTNDDGTVDETSLIEARSTRAWIKRHAEEGLLSVQSPSSLLVGALVQPNSGDAVLDVCAAPGSKTRQIVDFMSSSSSSFLSGRATPTGIVIANEFVSHRHHALANLLCPLTAAQHNRTSNNRPASAADHKTQQHNRWALLSSPATVAVSRHDGRTFPLFSSHIGGGFDRVLVDAPCSGDGMLHKFPSQWSTWSPSRALFHHTRQVELLRRAVEITATGGRIVYSTCTMNPLENEAVVAAVLSSPDLRNLVELEECHVPNFDDSSCSSGRNVMRNTMSGLRTWAVPVAETRLGAQPFRYVSSSSSSERTNQPNFGDINAVISHNSRSFSLPPTVFNSDQGVADAVAQCCWRIHPHKHRGFDAFFVAVLRKKKSSFLVDGDKQTTLSLTSSSSSSSPPSSPSADMFLKKTHPAIVWEAKCLREAGEGVATAGGRLQLERVTSEILNHFGIVSSNNNATRFLNGGHFALTQQRAVARHSSSAVLRLFSERAWDIATDGTKDLQHFVCSGAAIASVVISTASSSKSTTTPPPLLLSSWALTTTGAAILAQAASRNIVRVPASVFRLILAAGTRKSVSVKDLCVDDRAAMRNVHRKTLDDDDDDGADDDLTKRKTPSWVRDMCERIHPADPTAAEWNKTVIVACAHPRVYLPVIIVSSMTAGVSDDEDDDDEENILLTTTQLRISGGGMMDGTEVRRLVRLLSQTAEQPIKLDRSDAGGSNDEQRRLPRHRPERSEGAFQAKRVVADNAKIFEI